MLQKLISTLCIAWALEQQFVPAPPSQPVATRVNTRDSAGHASQAESSDATSPAATRPDAAPRSIGAVRTGMTAAEVSEVMGKPTQSARQILYRRYREQWYYSNLPGVWIEFDCFKGQDPRVVAVHKPAAGK
jgi:hypothetical protein